MLQRKRGCRKPTRRRFVETKVRWENEDYEKTLLSDDGNSGGGNHVRWSSAGAASTSRCEQADSANYAEKFDWLTKFGCGEDRTGGCGREKTGGDDGRDGSSAEDAERQAELRGWGEHWRQGGQRIEE